MILRIADETFNDIMDNPNLYLPIRWDGKRFEDTLSALFDLYIFELENGKNEDDFTFSDISVDIDEVEQICNNIKKCVQQYHSGFPAQAFYTLKRVMGQLVNTPLKVYQKTGWEMPFENDTLQLYRLRCVRDNTLHTRADIFHVPACARSMISTNRYSIAGHPSLYLTTSLELGKEELSGYQGELIASRFRLIRRQPELNIQVLELGIKPQDFINRNRERNNRSSRLLLDADLHSRNIKSVYLRWYPIIAVCSFIRANKTAPFSSEYIVPQLLMQWARTQNGKNRLMGFRYFSCASLRASELGFDYVFPTCNCNYEKNYCTVLRDAFALTEPVYLRDFVSIHDCEDELGRKSYDKI